MDQRRAKWPYLNYDNENGFRAKSTQLCIWENIGIDSMDLFNSVRIATYGLCEPHIFFGWYFSFILGHFWLHLQVNWTVWKMLKDFSSNWMEWHYWMRFFFSQYNWSKKQTTWRKIIRSTKKIAEVVIPINKILLLLQMYELDF